MLLSHYGLSDVLKSKRVVQTSSKDFKSKKSKQNKVITFRMPTYLPKQNMPYPQKRIRLFN